MTTKKEKCPDCGKNYTAGAPHKMFCEARTCSFCGSSFGHVLCIYDSREKPPLRKCDRCMDEEIEQENKGLKF